MYACVCACVWKCKSIQLINVNNVDKRTRIERMREKNCDKQVKGVK